MSIKNKYYNIKPFIPRKLQIFFRRLLVSHQLKSAKEIWPIDPRAKNPPHNWTGWPENKRFAFVLSHDVDTSVGYSKFFKLAELEINLGFRSSFNFVPERYPLTQEHLEDLKKMGFNVGVHGLSHDGKLFSSKKVFNDRALRINHYLRQWETKGFSSPSMHHKLDWMSALDIDFATSTFDTDPFEPQPDGVRTIFPFWAPRDSYPIGHVELPYTLPQDFTLFILMKNRDCSIWKTKLEWIAEKGGMALLNTHPDYMAFNGKNPSREEYPSDYYIEFLNFVKNKFEGQYWHVPAKEVARFWKKNMLNS